VHPAARGEGSSRLEEVLTCLEGLPLSAELWEQTVLPARVPDYQPRGLDECTAGGAWTWFCQGEGGNGPGLVAFWNREHLAELSRPPADSLLPPSAAVDAVLESLRQRGASFLTDLAQHTGLSPSAVRAALWDLLRARLVTNDRYDVLRKGPAAF